MARFLLLDTNLLLFFLVAQVDLAVLQSFKRVSKFRSTDLKPLQDLVDAFSAIVTTPHVLTETSNLIDQAPFPWKPRLTRALADFIESREERYQPAATLILREEFEHLGLADTALLALSRHAFVATLDYELYQRILAGGGEAIHFEHLRSAAMPITPARHRRSHA